ncbi:Protein of unknown function, partial [Cotesia congregata]
GRACVVQRNSLPRLVPRGHGYLGKSIHVWNVLTRLTTRDGWCVCGVARRKVVGLEAAAATAATPETPETETQTTTCWLQGTPRLGLYGREFSRGSLSEVAASEPESEVGVREGGARRRHTRRTRAVRPKTTRSQHAWRLVCGAGAASVRKVFSSSVILLAQTIFK